MIQAEIRLVRCLLALALVLSTPLLASQAQARPKAAKRASSAAGNAAQQDHADAPASAPEPEPAPPAQPVQSVQPAAAAAQDKPKLQVTPVAAAPTETKAAADAAQSAAAAGEKLAALRADVSTLTDDLVEARSRAAMLGKTLFKTQVRIRLQNLAAPDPVLVKVVLKLDGAPIYRTDGAALTGDEARQVFQGFIAPGAHVLSAEVEQRSRDDAAYGYVLHDTYRFQALREKRSELTLILDDDSDLASEFPDDSEGEYDVRVKLRVKTQDLNER